LRGQDSNFGEQRLRVEFASKTCIFTLLIDTGRSHFRARYNSYLLFLRRAGPEWMPDAKTGSEILSLQTMAMR
jgi:hypothetical protein